MRIVTILLCQMVPLELRQVLEVPNVVVVVIPFLPADLLRNTIADGRILSGKEAFDSKLIDGLGQFEDAFTKAKQLGNAPEAKFVKYGPPFSLSRFFRLFGQADSKLELQLPKQFVPQLETGRAYFLPSYYAP